MAVLDVEAVYSTRVEELKDKLNQAEVKAVMAEVWRNTALHFSASIVLSRKLRSWQQDRMSYVPFTYAWRARRELERALDLALAEVTYWR